MSILCSFQSLRRDCHEYKDRQADSVFEEPFWVGIFERVENGKLSVSKVTFGTEPKDYEIWEFVLKEYDRLQFSPSVEVTAKELTKNPKKLQREIHKQMLDRGVGTKSQQALKLQQEQRKQAA